MRHSWEIAAVCLLISLIVGALARDAYAQSGNPETGITGINVMGMRTRYETGDRIAHSGDREYIVGLVGICESSELQTYQATLLSTGTSVAIAGSLAALPCIHITANPDGYPTNIVRVRVGVKSTGAQYVQTIFVYADADYDGVLFELGELVMNASPVNGVAMAGSFDRILTTADGTSLSLPPGPGRPPLLLAIAVDIGNQAVSSDVTLQIVYDIFDVGGIISSRPLRTAPLEFYFQISGTTAPPTPPSAAFFKLSNLRVSPTQPVVNQSFNIYVTVCNDGTGFGNKEVVLSIDGSFNTSEFVGIDAGYCRDGTFTGSVDTSGPHTIQVSTPDDSASIALNVTGGGEPPIAPHKIQFKGTALSKVECFGTIDMAGCSVQVRIDAVLSGAPALVGKTVTVSWGFAIGFQCYGQTDDSIRTGDAVEVQGNYSNNNVRPCDSGDYIRKAGGSQTPEIKLKGVVEIVPHDAFIAHVVHIKEILQGSLPNSAKRGCNDFSLNCIGVVGWRLSDCPPGNVDTTIKVGDEVEAFGELVTQTGEDSPYIDVCFKGRTWQGSIIASGTPWPSYYIKKIGGPAQPTDPCVKLGDPVLKSWHWSWMLRENVLALSSVYDGIKYLHKQNLCGEGITVAIIDSGFDEDHPAAQYMRITKKKTYFVLGEAEGTADDTSPQGHGTMVAGVIWQVAPAAQFLIYKIEGAGNRLADAISQAVSDGADVINISGSRWFFLDITGAIATAVVKAVQKEVIVVASAGNSAQGASGPAYPSSIPEVISVSSSYLDSGICKPGSPLTASQDPVKPDIAAPACDSKDTMLYTLRHDGTARADFKGSSATAPQVAGVAALLKQAAIQRGYSTARQKIEQVLRQTAMDIPSTTLDGYGLLNPVGAYECLIPNNSQCAANISPPATSPPLIRDFGNVKRFDTNGNNRIEDPEFFTVIDTWISGQLDDAIFFQAIDLWVSQEPLTATAALSSIKGLSVEEIKVVPLFESNGKLRVHIKGHGVKETQLQLYDLNGRLMLSGSSTGRTLELRPYDAQDRPLAIGVYLYVATLKGFDDQIWRSTVRKLVILR